MPKLRKRRRHEEILDCVGDVVGRRLCAFAALAGVRTIVEWADIYVRHVCPAICAAPFLAFTALISGLYDWWRKIPWGKRLIALSLLSPILFLNDAIYLAGRYEDIARTVGRDGQSYSLLESG
jgi:hypothetical protein